MGFFDWTQDREQYLELENRVARLEEQAARLEEQVARLSAALAERDGVMQPPTASPSTTVEIAEVLEVAAPTPTTPDFAEARALASGGQRVRAIKVVRDQTGMGLREAMSVVDSWPG